MNYSYFLVINICILSKFFFYYSFQGVTPSQMPCTKLWNMNYMYIVQASKCNNSMAYNAKTRDAAALTPSSSKKKTKLHDYIDISTSSWECNKIVYSIFLP